MPTLEEGRMQGILHAFNNFFGTHKLDITDPVSNEQELSYIYIDRFLLVSWKSFGDNYWSLHVRLRFDCPWRRRIRINAYDAHDDSSQLRGTRCFSYDLLPDGSLDYGSMSAKFLVYTKGINRVRFEVRLEEEAE